MEPARAPAEFAQTLRDALDLPPDDQARLCAVLERVTGSPAGARLLPAVIAPAPPPEEPGVAQWLEQLAVLPAWTQLQLLDEAVETTDEAEELALLQSARTQLLRNHPPLAVRRAVVDIATRQPIAICVGSVGLVIGVFGIGRLLGRMLF